MYTSQSIRTVLALAVAGSAIACQPRDAGTARGTDSVPAVVDTIQRMTPQVVGRGIELPVTLPVLDAFFADSAFVAQLQPRLDLTDAQIDSLRRIDLGVGEVETRLELRNGAIAPGRQRRVGHGVGGPRTGHREDQYGHWY